MRTHQNRARRPRIRGSSARPRPGRILWTTGLTVVALTACNGNESPVELPTTSSVTVNSPVGDRLAADRSVQLEAVALDPSGNVLSGRSFTWTSSAMDVARVEASGRIEGLEAGSSTISASADGVTGDLAIEIVAVDFDAIRSALEDPFTTGLIGALGDTPSGLVDGALEDCATAMDTGHVNNLSACFDELASTSSTDPTDRALLAVLTLMTGHAARQIETS